LVRHKKCAFIKKNCNAGISKDIQYCFQDPNFPCEKRESLDARYCRDYGTSPITNLIVIRDQGMDAFLDQQYQAFTCGNCGGTISVHNGFCYDCQKEQVDAYVRRKQRKMNQRSKEE
jgi:hypothetical protein